MKIGKLFQKFPIENFPVLPVPGQPNCPVSDLAAARQGNLRQLY
jgi:hypothetical protein